jgi:choline kinase
MIEIEGVTLLSRLIHALQPLVPRIHVVVGYREEMIIEHCTRYHRDVVLVRNPDYRSTNTAHSIRLGSVGMHQRVLYLDGDLIIDPVSLGAFVRAAETAPLLVGITRAKSTQAVFVDAHSGGQDDMQLDKVIAFHRDPATEWEWANVFAGSPQLLVSGTHYVYECIEPHLPAAAYPLTLFEVDTPEDLELARAGIAGFAREG